MEHDTKQARWNTGNADSFASVAAEQLWPVVLTGAIDDMHKATGALTDEAAVSEGKSITSQIAALKYEIQHDRALKPLPTEAGADIQSYNNELTSLGSLTWHAGPWLFLDCYLYRRLASLFFLSTHWKKYDVFAKKKIDSFHSSRAAVLELTTRYNTIVSQLSSPSTELQSEEAQRLLFREMCDICLWGNATDLSLLSMHSDIDVSTLQGSSARKSSEKNILVNDADKAFDVLLKARQAKSTSTNDGERRVDIVLDNSGFELFVDLVLAAYLIHADLATVVVFHPKSIPWFVSDVLPTDFASTLQALLNAESFFGVEGEDLRALQVLSEDWMGLYAEGKFVLRPNVCWTGSGSYWRLPTMAADVIEDLRRAELVLFKGDLNYRKLTADAMWDPTTPFVDAIGPMGRRSGIRILSLRTCKADVIVGLPPGKDEELRQDTSGKRPGSGPNMRVWATTGKYAVIQFCDGKSTA